jgi:putative nucleotidyltransferase with HDIG domain
VYPVRTTEPLLPADVEAALEARLVAGLELPVLPEAAATIMTETSKETWQVSTVVAALTRDPALSAHLLRVANSPAFRGAGATVSAQQAVTRLGASHLRQVAVVIACETKAFSSALFKDEVRAVFRHSLATALFAREIARERRANVEESFLAGLLHDLGFPVALQAIVEVSKALGGPIDREAALAWTEAHHARLGAQVARAWRLPASVASAIEQHHHDAAGSALAATVSLGDGLARGAAQNDDAPVKAPALDCLNLYPDTLESLAARAKQVWAEASSW